MKINNCQCGIAPLFKEQQRVYNAHIIKLFNINPNYKNHILCGT